MILAKSFKHYLLSIGNSCEGLPPYSANFWFNNPDYLELCHTQMRCEPSTTGLPSSNAWSPASKTDKVNSYLQVDLIVGHRVTGFALHGDGSKNWVNWIAIHHSDDCLTWNTLTKGGTEKVKLAVDLCMLY